MTKILEFANQAGDHVTIKLDPDSMTVTNAGEMAAAVYELVYTGDDKYHRRAKESEIVGFSQQAESSMSNESKSASTAESSSSPSLLHTASTSASKRGGRWEHISLAHRTNRFSPGCVTSLRAKRTSSGARICCARSATNSDRQAPRVRCY